MPEKLKTETVPSVLVYGIEQVGVSRPTNPISTALVRMEFEAFDTDKKFHDYDGVIVFQSTFETISQSTDVFGDRHINVHCKSEELIRRQTQLLRLLENGGWICFLLHRGFIDRGRHGDFSSTDLCKIYLNLDSFYRKPFSSAQPITHISRSEFQAFLGEYGAASTYFENYNEWIKKNIKLICNANGGLTGFALENSTYFVPTRLPKESELVDFFSRLGAALVSTAKKLRKDIPVWVEGYRFPVEEELRHKEADIQRQLAKVRTQLVDFNAFKSALCFESDLLAESVKAILRNGLGLKLSDKDDEYLEDAMIVDDMGQDIALVEIKGMNENLKNPHIYQADSHRGRREKPPQFPSLLIVNTFIKSSNKVSDKLRDFGVEQIKLAVNKHVLAMRTIDLLNLMRLKDQDKLSSEQIRTLLETEAGWLKVSDDSFEIRKE